MLLTGCTALGGASAPPHLSGAAAATEGPAADYPMVLGNPYSVDGVTYTPSDAMNYDQVGRAAPDDAGAGITISHRTLPLPSYVEITSLATGRTILARVERRGPMEGAAFIGLSREARELLGEGDTVRVRRVNPPERERALLRSGQAAGVRMDTPASLLSVLRRKLDTAAVSLPSPPVPTTTAVASAPAPEPPAAAGRLVVQVGAFSSLANARRAAEQVGGYVEPAGRLHRVRMGPFPTQEEAAPALAKARAAGYRDAHIVTP